MSEVAINYLFLIINSSPEKTQTYNEFILPTSIVCVAT